MLIKFCAKFFILKINSKLQMFLSKMKKKKKFFKQKQRKDVLKLNEIKNKITLNL